MDPPLAEMLLVNLVPEKVKLVLAIEIIWQQCSIRIRNKEQAIIKLQGMAEQRQSKGLAMNIRRTCTVGRIQKA